MSEFAKNLLTWFRHNGRKALPWQQDHDPYKVWVSEIMLQQTQVRTVIPYFERFLQAFPTMDDLADAPLNDVLTHWAGLGYYARARNLHKTANIIARDYKGKFPKTLQTLVEMPGLGRSTASAILAIAFRQPLPILDGNVKRVLARYFGIIGYPGDKKIEMRLWKEAEQLMPTKEIPSYTQAMMDLGAMICTPKNPSCFLCPMQKNCVAFKEGTTAEIPAPKPKVHYPTKTAFFLILTDGKGIYLEQRPQKGIWGGLWCLPEFNRFEDLRQWCNLKRQSFEVLEERMHLFTHYRLRFTPALIKNKALRNLTPFSELKNYGLPAPIKRLLDDLKGGLIADTNPTLK